MERKVNSKLLYKGRNFRFLTDRVKLPNGLLTTRDTVDHPGAVAIIPILSDGRIILVRQYRYAIERKLMEIPAGTIEKEEEPLDCAIRELREETGYEAGRIEKFMECFIAPGYSNELIQFYVATELKRLPARNAPDEEITIYKIGVKEATRMINENIIKDAKTIAGLLTYLHIYSNQNQIDVVTMEETCRKNK